MKHFYYLVAQLPAFSTEGESGKLPLTTEYFLELCSRFLEGDDKKAMENLSLEPSKVPSSSSSAFLNEWYSRERDLRNALAHLRALKMKKDTKDIPSVFDGEIVQVARTATGMESPLAAEQYLNGYRLSVLERLMPLDQFSLDAVYCYGLRLMLTERIRKFNKDEGWASYHKIYEEILGETK